MRNNGLDDSPCPSTPNDVEGPFYTVDAPSRTTLADPNEPGERISISGTILDVADCTTGLGGYVLDLWHADDAGVYDNVGFKLRGRVAADADGSFAFDTIMPGSYPARPEHHIHVKLLRPDGTELLTTQIYFEGDSNLSGDNVGPRVRLQGGVGQLNFIVSA